MADAGKSHSADNTDSRGIIKLLKDEPNENGNQFGFGTYSKVLSEIVENSPSPFAIGIFGGWGTGKTTLMRLIKETLKNNRKVLTVWFDPWRYENEEYLAVIPLLRTIRLSLQQFTDENQIDLETSRWKKLKESLEFSMEAFLNSMTLKVGIQNLASVDIRGKEIVDSFKVKNLQDSEFMSEANTVFYHAVDYLEKALQNVLEEDEMFRIVVFIDDLDRCSPSKSFQVLESIKSFFDIPGMVYIIGMNNTTIDTLISQKFGENAVVSGFDYMKKLVQLQFQMPKWVATDISTFIENTISNELKDSTLNKTISPLGKKLLVKAVEPNPREAKRFINNIIVAEAVFRKPVEALIVVNALQFNPQWNRFLDFITPVETRKKFFEAYTKRNEDPRAMDNFKDQLVICYPRFFELDDPLRQFLDDGAEDVLTKINNMTEYLRALDSVSSQERPLDQVSVNYTAELDPRYKKRNIYQITIWVEAPEAVLKQITRVEYKLPVGFPQRQYVIERTLENPKCSTRFLCRQQQVGLIIDVFSRNGPPIAIGKIVSLPKSG